MSPSRTLCVAPKHSVAFTGRFKRPVTSIGRFKRPVASIGHFKATPRSTLVIVNKSLPAGFNKQRSRRQVASIYRYYCSANR